MNARPSETVCGRGQSSAIVFFFFDNFHFEREASRVVVVVVFVIYVESVEYQKESANCNLQYNKRIRYTNAP